MGVWYLNVEESEYRIWRTWTCRKYRAGPLAAREMATWSVRLPEESTEMRDVHGVPGDVP